MGWIDMASNRDRWWALVNEVTNLLFPSNSGNSWTENLSVSLEGLCSIDLVI